MRLVRPSYEIMEVMPNAPLEHIERCGRLCYKSEDKIGPGTARKFARMIIKLGHESVLEHASMTVRFIANRGFTHELVRHRLAAYSQESTRYCDYAKACDEVDGTIDRAGGHVSFIVPIWMYPYVLPKIVTGDFLEGPFGREGPPFVVRWLRGRLADEEEYHLARAGTLSIRDGAEDAVLWNLLPQDARDCLPIALKTEIAHTANVREWRHIFRMRCAKAAHPQMRELMLPLRAECVERWPALFEDLVLKKETP